MNKSYKVKKVTRSRTTEREVGGFCNDVTFVTLLTFLDRIDTALHVEILLGHVVMFAVENFFKTADCFCNRHVLSFVAGKDFSHMKWLAKEPLNLACALNSDLVLRA